MNEFFNLLTNVRDDVGKGVKMMIRTCFLFFVFFVMLLVIIVAVFSSGWVRVVVDAKEVREDIDRTFNIMKNNDREESGDDVKYIEQIEMELLKNGYDTLRHRLNEGENLLDLERIYGINARVIQKVNGIRHHSQLETGQLIVIPLKLKLP